MTTLTTSQQAEVEKPVTRTAYFAEFHFTTGILRVCSLGQNYDCGGNTWLGVGTLGSISDVVETSTTESSPVTFTLNCAQASMLATGLSSPDTYRGQAAKLYMCPLDDQFRLIDTPVICWRGFMDMMALNIDKDGTGNIQLKCETSAFGLSKMPNYRMNAAQQKLTYPEDTGFDYLTYLITQPQVWFSVAAQTIILHR
jgi:hypothetical protein